MTDRDLNRALAAWGQWQPTDDAAIARLIGHADALAFAAAPQSPPDRRRWWMLGAGGALAASLALGVLLLGPALTGNPEPSASADPSASFAMLYTPTMEEEYLL